MDQALYYNPFIRRAVAGSNKISFTHISVMQRMECKNDNLESVIVTVLHIQNWNVTRAQRSDSEIISLPFIVNSLYKIKLLSYLYRLEQSDYTGG